MLSPLDNDTLTKVGPKTLMGDFFRLYWIPFLTSKDLVPDGQPKRVKLLGEDLVAFRDTQGRVGLVENACPHRGAPLMFGRNEECGLRCVYHGWKFDVTGAVVDMPAEPEASRFQERYRVPAYPCRERNGVIWTYMGRVEDGAELPPLPNVEWNLVPEVNCKLSLRVQECNWLQALEGEIDSAHAPILHGRLEEKGEIASWVAKKDLRPTFECIRQDFGMSIAARRRYDDERLYWRVNQYMMPFYTLVPPLSARYPELSGHAWVPIDDNNTLCFMFSYHPSEPLNAKSRQIFENGHEGRETAHASLHCYDKRGPLTPYGDFMTKYNRDTNYHFDYESQQTTWFSGLPGLWVQDGACQSGLTPIFDRMKEHLCSSDAGIAMTRRMLLETVRGLRERGIKPKGVTDPDVFLVRAVSLKLPEADSWVESGREHMQARPGTDFGYDL